MLTLAVLSATISLPATTLHHRLWHRPPWVAPTWPILGSPLATFDDFRWFISERLGRESYPRLREGECYEKMIFDARQDPMRHATGRAGAEGWVASPSRDKKGHMLFGPYTRRVKYGANHIARFNLLIGSARKTAGGDDMAAEVEVYDSTFDRTLARKRIPAGAAATPGAWVDHDLLFNCIAGHSLEFRVFYFGITDVTIRSVTIDP